MRNLTFGLMCWLGCLSVSTAYAQKPLALVYKGYGACPAECSESAAQMALQAEFSVEFVWPEEITEERISKARLWIQPGGESLQVAQAMRDHQKKILNEFVRRGGAYVGFCAGGFFADRWVHGRQDSLGLGLTPGESDDYIARTGMVQVQYRGQTRHLYFEEGPYFRVNSEAQILATYPQGEAAIIQFAYGLGRVALSGPHPEAPQFWRTHHQARDPDGLDYDIAIDMIRWATSSAF